MRKKTEQELTLLLLKGHTPAQAAYEILYNGRHVTTDEIEELEELILRDFFVSVRYMRAVKNGNWPALSEHIKENSINMYKELNDTKDISRSEYTDALIYIRAYAHYGDRVSIDGSINQHAPIAIKDNLLKFGR